MSELTPYICVSDARAAIQWYAEALGAEVTYEPIIMDDGRVGHCELAVGEARWMMSDEFEGYGIAVPDPQRGAHQVHGYSCSRKALRSVRGP